jgi:hypothetical protein
MVRVLQISSNTVWAYKYPSNLLGGQLRYVITIPRQNIYLLSQ